MVGVHFSGQTTRGSGTEGSGRRKSRAPLKGQSVADACQQSTSASRWGTRTISPQITQF